MILNGPKHPPALVIAGGPARVKAKTFPKPKKHTMQVSESVTVEHGRDIDSDA